MSGKQIPAQLPPLAENVLAQLSSDLVDEDDRDPAWLNSIADSINAGAVRQRIYEIIDAALPAQTQ
jgi:hypothetical protein